MSNSQARVEYSPRFGFLLFDGMHMRKSSNGTFVALKEFGDLHGNTVSQLQKVFQGMVLNVSGYFLQFNFL